MGDSQGTGQVGFGEEECHFKSLLLHLLLEESLVICATLHPPDLSFIRLTLYGDVQCNGMFSFLSPCPSIP